jgi:hypothetical protein
MSTMMNDSFIIAPVFLVRKKKPTSLLTLYWLCYATTEYGTLKKLFKKKKINNTFIQFLGLLTHLSDRFAGILGFQHATRSSFAVGKLLLFIPVNV